MSKQLAEHLGLKTAPWVVCSKEYPLCKIAPFPGPYFVKPRFGSASINIDESSREFDTLKSKKVPQSLEIGLFFCQIFIFII